MIYLDSAATTLQKPSAVARAMAEAVGAMTSPGRGNYGPSSRASRTLLALREKAAELFGMSRPEQVILTHNATHGLNLAVKTMVRPGARVLLSGWEHNAVTRPLAALGAKVRVASGRLFDQESVLEDFRRLLPGAKCAVCTHVSNVFGWILPVEEIAALCSTRGIPLVVDASQSAGSLEVNMEALGAAFIAMPGHKGLLGPQGTGLLLCGHPVKTILEGGTGSLSRQPEMPDFLPDRLESGTQNVPGAAGLLAGIRYLRRVGIRTASERETELRRELVRQLRRIPGVEVFYGENQAGTVSFRVRNRDCVLLASRLAEQGIALRAGLHCAPLAHETAGTLETGTLRVSYGPFNTRQDGKELCRRLEKILERPEIEETLADHR